MQRPILSCNPVFDAYSTLIVLFGTGSSIVPCSETSLSHSVLLLSLRSVDLFVCGFAATHTLLQSVTAMSKALCCLSLNKSNVCELTCKWEKYIKCVYRQRAQRWILTGESHVSLLLKQFPSAGSLWLLEFISDRFYTQLAAGRCLHDMIAQSYMMTLHNPEKTFINVTDIS